MGSPTDKPDPESRRTHFGPFEEGEILISPSWQGLAALAREYVKKKNARVRRARRRRAGHHAKPGSRSRRR